MNSGTRVLRNSGLIALVWATLILVAAQQVPIYAATTGTIVGEVRDAETGEPLQGVNISLVGTPLTTVSDARGVFSFTNIVPDTYEVSADLVGYAPAEITDIDVQMDLATAVKLQMSPTVQEEPDVVIVQNQIITNPDASQNLYTRTGRDEHLSKASPNSFYQVPDIVSTVPGVVQDELGNLHIRGGRDDEIGWMIEGIPVTNPIDNTFGTNLVTVGMSRLQVYTGGYQAQYGNAISGILNEIKRTGSDIMGSDIELTLGSNQFAGLYAEAGNVLNNGTEWYFGNYSWRSDFRRYIANTARSSDSVLKLVHPCGDDNRFTFLYSTGSARYGIPEIPEAPFEDQSHTTQGYSLLGLTWNRNLSPDSHFIIRPYYFFSKNNINALATQLGDSATSRSIQRGIQAEYYRNFGERHNMLAGVWYIRGSNLFRRYIPNLAESMGAPPEIAEMLDPFDYTSDVDTTQVALFLQDKFRMSSTLTADLGLRYDKMHYDKAGFEDDTDDQISPRAGLAWSRDPRTVVRASVGRFIQFVPTSVLARAYTNPMWESVYASDAILDPERAISYEIGLERQVAPNTLFRITPYYREYQDLIDRVPINPDDPDSPYTFVSAASATSRGVEVYLARKMGAGTRGWVSYTWSRTRLPSMFNPTEWTDAAWDQRHTVDATLQHSLGLADYSLRLQYGSGLPWTSMEDMVENRRRVGDNFVVTAGITRRLGPDPDDGAVDFHIYNLLNSGNATSLGPDASEATNVLPRFISVSYTTRW